MTLSVGIIIPNISSQYDGKNEIHVPNHQPVWNRIQQHISGVHQDQLKKSCFDSSPVPTTSIPHTICGNQNLKHHMCDCENPIHGKDIHKFGKVPSLTNVCTIMIYGKLGGYRLQETAVFIYIYDELWIICDIWVSLIWILEKYDDITLKRGIANLGRSHRLPRVFNNFHQFP